MKPINLLRPKTIISLLINPAFIGWTSIIVTIFVFYFALRPSLESLRLQQLQTSIIQEERLEKIESERIGTISPYTLKNININLDIAKFTEQLGIPSSKWEKDPNLYEYYFLSSKAAVTAYTEKNSSLVFAYTITVFNPDNFEYHIPSPIKEEPEKTYKLGKTSFKELRDYLHSEPWACNSYVGARRFYHYEQYYFGNPGLYITWGYAYNDAGLGIQSVTDADQNSNKCDNPGISALINTLIVISSDAPSNANSVEIIGVGVDKDKIRQLFF